MLCLILDSHPNLRVYDEDVAYDLIGSDKYRSEGLVGFKIPIWTQRYKFMKKNVLTLNIYFCKGIQKASWRPCLLWDG